MPSSRISVFVTPSRITAPVLSRPPSSNPVESKASKIASSITACTSTVIVLEAEVDVNVSAPLITVVVAQPETIKFPA